MKRFKMDAWILGVVIVYLSLYEVEAEIKSYAFDQRKYCPENGAHTKALMVNDKVILLAKSKSDSFLIDKIKNFFNEPVTECEMKFMTSSQDSNTKPALEIEFESFNIARDACDVILQIHQSPTQFFTKDVTEMVTLTCGSPTPPVLYSERGYNIRFRFVRPKNDNDYFNFRITVKRSEGTPRDEGMSIGVKIGVTVISVAAAITLLLLIYKFIKLRCETKDIENQSQRSPNGSDPDEAENLHDYHDDNNFVMTDFPYANMPIVILNGDEAPPAYKDIAPPAYEEALQMPKATESHDEATYSNIGNLNNQSALDGSHASSNSSLTGSVDAVETSPGNTQSSQSNRPPNEATHGHLATSHISRQPNDATTGSSATVHSTEQTQV
ncbi:uncharacterized protein LOC111106801 isoform X1 [Crassostrea virginica]